MDINDHRRIGQRLDLFHIEEDAPGMVFWHPRGALINQLLEDYIRRHLRPLGYEEVRSPQLLPRSFWERSGHWGKFREGMFVHSGPRDSELALKPMSCPCHVRIFNSRPRSWRDLPVRYAEFGICHRDEPSGSLLGLMRTRSFEQDDAHVLCTQEQAQGEILAFIGLLGRVYRDLGFDDFEVALSTRPDVRSGTEAQWNWAETELRYAVEASGLPFSLQPGEGAFYGPKLEFILKDAQGRQWQCGTVQLDCVLPGRLGAGYVAQDGSLKVPVMIHHAVFGSVGRFIGVLLEHHSGRLPAWLCPVQVAVVPVSKKQSEYALEVAAALGELGIRCVVSDADQTLSRRLVNVHADGVPFAAIVGNREEKERSISLRGRCRAQSPASLADTLSSLRCTLLPPDIAHVSAEEMTIPVCVMAGE